MSQLKTAACVMFYVSCAVGRVTKLMSYHENCFLLSFLIHVLTGCTVNVVITSRNTLRTLQGSTNVDMVEKINPLQLQYHFSVYKKDFSKNMSKALTTSVEVQPPFRY